MFKEILSVIQEYDKISIFRHVRPDGDCMFSAIALESFIHDNFPKKQVKIAGEDTYDVFQRNDKLSDSYIRNSLAIVVDTSSHDRIDDTRSLSAPFVIKIDHHPIEDKYGNINYVDPKAAACAEIIAEMFLSPAFKGMIISQNTCRYLYAGIIADTINFRTTNTSAKTLSIASKLVKKGNLDVASVVEYVMDKDLAYFKHSTKIRSKLKVKGHFGYIVLSKEQLDKIGVTNMEAKINIDEIGKIKEFNIWSIATENDGLYDVSVRSRRGYTINEICAHYGGGGHKNAAAAKKLTKKDLNEMYKILYLLAEKQDSTI
ncbi:MAG: DHH family phosphoesterase [Erysipelotrichaceae bacterium]|nr:DHH family phosphoesterase [Erysipelotrichaceae bacterium]